jgi:hypothetical protein
MRSSCVKTIGCLEKQLTRKDQCQSSRLEMRTTRSVVLCLVVAVECITATEAMDASVDLTEVRCRSSSGAPFKLGAACLTCLATCPWAMADPTYNRINSSKLRRSIFCKSAFRFFLMMKKSVFIRGFHRRIYLKTVNDCLTLTFMHVHACQKSSTLICSSIYSRYQSSGNFRNQRHSGYSGGGGNGGNQQNFYPNQNRQNLHNKPQQQQNFSNREFNQNIAPIF